MQNECFKIGWYVHNDGLFLYFLCVLMPRRLRFKGQTLRRNIAELEVLAFKIFRGGHPPSPSLFVRDKRFRGWCGCSSETAAKCWMLLTRGGLKKGATMERFLWGLMMLTSYDTEIVGAGRVGGVDEKTFVKWAWYFVDAISFLEGDLVRCLLLS